VPINSDWYKGLKRLRYEGHCPRAPHHFSCATSVGGALPQSGRKTTLSVAAMARGFGKLAVGKLPSHDPPAGVRRLLRLDAQEFVDLVDHEVGCAAIDGVLSQLEQPAGRRPPEHLVRLSKWFNSLDETGKMLVREVVAETASASLFGFYCVLDGSRAIVNDPTREHLELICRGKAGDNLISSTSFGASQLLHEMRGALL